MNSEPSVYDFAYLDEDVAGDYLSGLTGSVATPTHGANHKGGSKRARAGAGAGPFEIGGEIGRDDSRETHFEFRQGPSAPFYNLRSELEKRDHLKMADELNPTNWADLREGRFINVRGRVEVSPLDSFIQMASEIYDLGMALGAIDPSDQETKKTVQGIALLSKSGAKALSVFIQPSGTANPRSRFFSNLNRSKLLVPVDELNARFRVFGRIRTVLEPGETVDLLKLPGNMRLPRDQFRELTKKLATAPLLGRQIRPSDLKVTAPAVEITTIAIFR